MVAEALDRLGELLSGLEVGKVRRGWTTPSGDRADLTVQVRRGRGGARLVIEVKSIGEPRQAVAAVGQLRRLVRGVPRAYPVFLAPFIPASSRRILREEGVGYVDLSGNAFLSFGPVLVDRSAPDPPARRRPGTRELLAPKTTRVLRALLNDPGRAYGIRELAARCRVSPAAVVFAARLLEDKALISRDLRRRILLTRPGALLDFWAANWSVERNVATRYFTAAPEPRDTMDAVGRLARREGLRYALTLHAGASLVAPFVRFGEVWMYAPGDPKRWVDGLELAPATAGANLVLLEPYDEGAMDFSREVKGKRVVSDAQLYVDLYNFPARGREQAEFLRERRMPFGREAG